MDKKLISIIVPIYNIESFISRCIESIIKQTYKNLEIILVDDGSTDGSGVICDKYALKDPRIKVIHKENGGLSDARNTGLDAVSGEYITFIDGDDWYDKTIINDLIKEISKDVQVISYSFSLNYSGGKEIKRLVPNKTMLFDKAALELCNGTIDSSVCSKLFKKEFIKNTRFKKGRLNEDFYFLLELSINNYHSNFIFKQINLSGYHYYMREGSITHSRSGQSVLDAIDNCIDLIELCAKTNIDLMGPLSRMGFHQSFVSLNVNPVFSFRKQNIYFSKPCFFVRRHFKYLFKSRLRFKEKIICFFFFFFPHLVGIEVYIIRKVIK